MEVMEAVQSGTLFRALRVLLKRTQKRRAPARRGGDYNEVHQAFQKKSPLQVVSGDKRLPRLGSKGSNSVHFSKRIRVSSAETPSLLISLHIPLEN
jgi:hypothetical protein